MPAGKRGWTAGALTLWGPWRRGSPEKRGTRGVHVIAHNFRGLELLCGRGPQPWTADQYQPVAC